MSESEPDPAPAQSPAAAPDAGAQHHGGRAALTLGALGVVFGDIGTSPLYAMKETFAGAHVLAPAEANVYGVISLIFWAITIIVSVKYVLLIMRADNGGEGGIMALIALVQGLRIDSARAKVILIALGVFGAALFFGDAMITPAISVLSAVEGLELVQPSFGDFVIPITVAILTTLFAIQRFGTAVVGRLFGPVMGAWFGTLALLGLLKVVQEPSILRALSPHYGIAFFVDNGGKAFLALASVVLAVTGAEALYADMGHFGRSPIKRAWFYLVLPALVLQYMGQGVLLLEDPGAVESPLYRLVPDELLVPLVLLATAAAVIASQAVISGAFSVTRQAVQLGFLPMLTIKHTSRREAGQIYVPAINWGLYAIIVVLVIGFGSSSALASAYGIAVTGTLAIDTILFFVVVRLLWKRSLAVTLIGGALFLVVDLAFFAANLTKVVSGGWFPLVVAAIAFGVLMTWRRGSDVVKYQRAEEEGPLVDFVVSLQELAEPPRVPGTAVFLNADATKTPLAMRYNVEHNRVLHEHVVVCSVETVGIPHVSAEDRLEVDELLIPDDGIALVKLKYGFQDEPNVPEALRHAVEHGLEVDVDGASYFLSRVTIASTHGGGMATWRKRLFTAMSRNAAGRVQYFCLPEEQVVSFGSQIRL